MISQLNVGSAVVFPEWRGERHYMLPFTLRNGLPKSIGRFETTVAQMIEGLQVNPDQECYIMIDEKEVSPGNFHRRPGLHVDGYWYAATQKHGGGHKALCHAPQWTPVAPPPGKEDYPVLPTHHRGHRGASGKAQEALLLASSYSAAQAVVGIYERDFVNDWRGGDCSDLSTYGLQEVLLQANRAYHMDVMTLHESLPITESVRRTLVRINVPGVVLS
jgi:hypothetical protein